MVDIVRGKVRDRVFSQGNFVAHLLGKIGEVTFDGFVCCKSVDLPDAMGPASTVNVGDDAACSIPRRL